jgi:hypothetical protein
MRQAAGVKAAECIVAQGRESAFAWQSSASSRKGSAKRLLGRRLHGAYIRVHQAASP